MRRLEASTRLAEPLHWPGLKQVCRLERTTIRRGKQTVEVQYAITSAARSRADAALLLTRWRDHWGIENQLHWVRDVTWGEDQCQVRTGHAPQNLAAFGVLNGMIAEELKQAELDYPSDSIEAAFREAARNNAHSWNYLRKVLENWKAAGQINIGNKQNGKNPTKGTDPDVFDRVRERLKNAEITG